MAITVTAPVAITKTARTASEAFLASSRARIEARKEAAAARLTEVVEALKGLTPTVKGVGPSVILEEKHAALAAKAAKAAGLSIKKRKVADNPKAVQVWVK